MRSQSEHVPIGKAGLVPEPVLRALAVAELPCFVYDATMVKRRATLATSLLDGYFFPVKACPEPDIVRAALGIDAGLDLCSEGDADIASAAGCAGTRWKLASACAGEPLLRRMLEAGAALDADSFEQALLWQGCGGRTCGLRIAGRTPGKLYGPKFGIGATEAAATAQRLAAAGVRVEGLHVHGQHANLSPPEFAAGLVALFSAVDPQLLRDCRYLNIGGGWPMKHGKPAPVEDLRLALAQLRRDLETIGFRGKLYGEPGRWVAGPCGYWAARVAAVKDHPRGAAHRVIVLDTSTPIPCRPSLDPFAALRSGRVLREGPRLTCDIFGAANTALDSIGVGVRLPAVQPGDVLVSLGQGAYTRCLIPPFNERDRPGTIVLGA